IDALGRYIETSGGQASRRTDVAELLIKSRVTFMKLYNDQGILHALQISEQKLNLEYARYLSTLTAVPGLEQVLKRNRIHNAKRLGWFEGELNLLRHTQRKQQ